MSLPGTTQAMQDAITYARVSGYLSKRYVDIGDRVKAGQLLAEIESPELDQQLNQAQANLQQFIKQLDLQKATWSSHAPRCEALTGRDREGAVAKLTVDQAVATYSTAKASVAAAQATVDAGEGHGSAIQGDDRVRAASLLLSTASSLRRNVDVGALITAGSPTNNTSVAPTSRQRQCNRDCFFEISQIDTLRWCS